MWHARTALRALAMLALLPLFTSAATAADGGDQAAARALQRYAPVLRYDVRDRYPATTVGAFLAGADPLAPTRSPDAVYGHALRGTDGRLWLQYWRFMTYNPQDRGVLRTGRHEGDWEFTQVGLGRGDHPERVTFAQHSWAESCAWSAVQRAGGHPLIYVANGSHASYRTAGEHGRPWPDPDDEARADGRRVLPHVVLITSTSPSWVRRRTPWGRSRASWVPAENGSPPGPLFQADGRWQDPAAYDARARACGSGAPERPPVVTLALGGAVAVPVAGVGWWWRRRRRGRHGSASDHPAGDRVI
jgi:hypothetical protein